MSDIEVAQRKLIILRGLPGAGKSTFAIYWVSKSPAERTRINRDNIRFEYYGAYWGEQIDELGVTEIEHGIAETIMRKGKRDIVSDATNLKNIAVMPYLLLAEKYNYEVEFKDFEINIEELVIRDNTRRLTGERFLGEEVIRMLSDSFYVKNKLRAPASLT